MTPWTAAYQAPPSMGFSRQEYWSGLPLPSPLSTHTLRLILFAGGSQVGLVVKKLPANAGDVRFWFDPWVGKVPWRRAQQPTPLFLPGESHGQKSLAGYSPEGHTESDTTEVTEHTCMQSSVIAMLPVKSSGLGSIPGSVPRSPYPHL